MCQQCIGHCVTQNMHSSLLVLSNIQFIPAHSFLTKITKEVGLSRIQQLWSLDLGIYSHSQINYTLIENLSDPVCFQCSQWVCQSISTDSPETPKWLSKLEVLAALDAWLSTLRDRAGWGSASPFPHAMVSPLLFERLQISLTMLCSSHWAITRPVKCPWLFSIRTSNGPILLEHFKNLLLLVCTVPGL